jgi:hypothetical protein
MVGVDTDSAYCLLFLPTQVADWEMKSFGQLAQPPPVGCLRLPEETLL